MPSSTAVRMVWIADESLAAKIAVGRSRERQQAASRRLGGGLLEAAVEHQLGIEGDSGLLEPGPVALLAQARRFEVAATAEETDPSMTELDQVARGGQRAFEVLRREGRETRTPRSGGRQPRPVGWSGPR